MNIDVATHADIEAVCDIDRLVIGNGSRRQYLEDCISRGTCVVAKVGEEAVGFAIYDTSFFECSFIHLIITHLKHRRKGVARSLIRYIEDHSATAKLFTSTNASNTSMQKVCESLGFVRSGIIENLDEDDPEWIYFKIVKMKQHSAPHDDNNLIGL